MGERQVAEDVKREITLIIPMFPDMELAAVRVASGLAQLMSFTEEDIDEIKLALIEACLNAFEHSESRDGKVNIRFIMKGDELELKIIDRGVGFKVDKVKKPDIRDALKCKRKRGWGLEIIKNLMDKVEIESSDKGTTVTMVKRKSTALIESTGTKSACALHADRGE